LSQRARKKRRKKPAADVKAASRLGEALSAEWQTWVVENLLAGATDERVRAGLREAGVSEDLATRAIAALRSTPAFQGAARVASRARRAEQVLKLLRTGWRDYVVPRVEDVDADTFYELHYAAGAPALLPDYARGWPAVGTWDLAYLAERVGDAELDVTEGRDAMAEHERNSGTRSTRTSVRELVARIEAAGETDDFYAVARNRNLAKPALAPLFDDLDFSRGILDAERCRTASGLWLGPQGTLTPLHHDTSNILFVQVFGRKRVTLVSPTETSLLDGAHAMYALRDPEAEWTGATRDVKKHVLELGPGDTLFLPAGWWHHVRALTPSISLAFNGFTRDRNSFPWYLPGSA